MVEINNQRKAFLDMLAWSEGTDNGRRNWNHGYDVIVGGELFWSSDHLAACHAKPVKSTGAGRCTNCCVGGMPTASSLAWKTSLRKSGRCVPWWGAWRFTYDWSWWLSVGQSTVAAISGLHCRALVMVSSSRADGSLIAKFEAGGTVRDWCCGRRSPRSLLWLSAHHLPVMGC